MSISQRRLFKAFVASIWFLVGSIRHLSPAGLPLTSRFYNNPILFADYSDPDVIRDGVHYYLIASTFHFVPGIPILQSTDLVHWRIAGHVVQRMEMDPRTA
jgi:beta-xylosidase